MKFLSALFIACAAISTYANNSDKDQIKALYAKLENALRSKDINAVEATEAPDFTDTENGRKLSKAEANKQMKTEFASIKSLQVFKINLTSLKINGNTAHGTTTYSMKFKSAGMTSGDKTTHSYELTGSTEEDLVKTHKGWLFKSTKNKGSKLRVDGKPMKMG